MSTTEIQTRTVHTELLAEAGALRLRAIALRSHADDLGNIVAPSYRRRASELELESWLLEVRSGIPDELIHFAA